MMMNGDTPNPKGETAIPKALFRAGDNYLIVILGPTAIGKTTVAIELAKAFDTEIISADSRQFFREMNIGTAKPTTQELLQARHHFIDSISVTDEYNAGMFERDALKTIDGIFKKKNAAILAGGSGLYINAVCNGFDQVLQADREIRGNLTEMYKREGLAYLQNTLSRLDPEHYKKADIKNPHRLIRAIEVCMITGKPYSGLRKGEKQKRNFVPIKIGLTMDREKLYSRINTRVENMMKTGLLEEVKALTPFRAGSKELNSLLTVGYKELFDHLDGKMDLKQAVELIKQNTRNFAKRQMTWFRKDSEIKWFEPTDLAGIIAFIKKMLV